jgi:flagellar hook assembly protein FlgD
MRPIPNPFHDRTRIHYRVPDGEATAVEIAVYDVSGRRIRGLVSAVQAPGLYDVTWDRRGESGQTVAPGIYYLKQSTALGVRNVARMIVLE